MYSVIVISLPGFAIWLAIGMVVEAIAIGILAYLVLRTACTVSIVETVQHNHGCDIDELWTIHEGDQRASPKGKE